MCKWESLATLANGDTVDGATFPYTGKVDYIFASPGVDRTMKKQHGKKSTTILLVFCQQNLYW